MSSVADKLAQKSERRTSKKQVRLRLVHIDFWSTVKLAFLLSVCVGIVIIVASFIFWMVLEQTGLIGTVDGLLNDVSGGNEVKVENFVNLGVVMMFSLVCAALEIIVMTALSAIAAFLYNLSVRLTGGLVFGFTNS